MIVRESMDSYLAREAVSRSMAWNISSECPRYAYLCSPFSSEDERVPRKQSERMEFGEIAHLAILESHLLHERVLIVSEKDWRTNRAKEMRDVAISEGKIAILLKDFERIGRLRKALEADEEAGPLLFGKGESELTYTWVWGGVPCKARIDRLAEDDAGKILVHLKTSESANPRAFEHVGARLGYAMTCAWYLDGWRMQSTDAVFDTYRVVVVASQPPHLATVCYYDVEDIENGRTRYKQALGEFRRARESGVWRGYGTALGPQLLREPAWYRKQMADLEGGSRDE
jgi:hypothetical protein